MFRSIALAAASFVVLAGAPAFAHTTLAGSSPASGSILPKSPDVVTLTFHAPASLTSVVVVHEGKPDRKLETMPSGKATDFMAHDPNLTEGRNEIKWKALSADGHPIDGSIIVVIKAGAAPSSPSPAPMNHDHH